MLSTKSLLDQAISLPVEERADLVDLILKSLNKPNNKIDKQWLKVAKRRLDELRSGNIQAITGQDVFKNEVRYVIKD